MSVCLKRAVQRLVLLSIFVLLIGCGNQAASSESVAAETTTSPESTATGGGNETAVQSMDLTEPKQVVDTFAGHIKNQQYANVEPLMTDFLRDTFVKGAGSVEAGFRTGDERDGKLVSYEITDARGVNNDTAEVDITLVSERRTTESTIDLLKTNAGWQIAGIRDRR